MENIFYFHHIKQINKVLPSFPRTWVPSGQFCKSEAPTGQSGGDSQIAKPLFNQKLSVIYLRIVLKSFSAQLIYSSEENRNQNGNQNKQILMNVN